MAVSMRMSEAMERSPAAVAAAARLGMPAMARTVNAS